MGTIILKKVVLNVINNVLPALRQVQTVLLANKVYFYRTTYAYLNATLDTMLKVLVVQNVINSVLPALRQVQTVLLANKVYFYRTNDQNFICFFCDQSCSKCSGPEKFDCTQCASGLIYQPTLSLCAQCEEGQYFNQSTKLCENCFQDCLTCSGCFQQDQQEVDLKCKDSFEDSEYLSNALDIIAIICIPLANSDTQYAFDLQQTLIALRTEENTNKTKSYKELDTVSDTDANAKLDHMKEIQMLNVCKSMQKLHLVNILYSLCEQFIVKNQYFSQDLFDFQMKQILKQTKRCIQCNESCGTCSSSSSICDTCASGFELRATGVCARKCPANSIVIQEYYYKIFHNQLLNQITFFYSSSGKYTCQCNKGYFPVLSSQNYIQQCNQCSSGCSQCTNSSTCQECIDGYFKNLTSCQQCNPICITCTSLKECQSCQLGYYLEGRSTYGICVKACNKNEIYDDYYNCICSPQYLWDEKNVCQKIQPDGTIACGINYVFDKDSQKCLQCISDIQQNIPCVTSCRKEQYFDKVNLTCSQCLPQYGNKCQLSCSKNEYMDNIGICRLCYKSCNECKGPLESDCISCTNKLVFQPTLKKCAQCEEGQFYNENINNCDYCDYTCLICSGKKDNECILCQVGLQLSPISNKCLKQLEYQKEQEYIQQLQDIGCISDNQHIENDDCKSKYESSQFLNKILEILSITNIVLAFFSSIFTSSCSIISWVFIQNQQIIGNYIFSTNFNSIWMNSFELKTSYAHHIFTLIPNPFKYNTEKQYELYNFNQFDTIIQVNTFWDNIYNNCFLLLLSLAIILFLLFVCGVFNKSNNNSNQTNNQIQKMYNYLKWNLLVNFFRVTSSFFVFNISYIIIQQQKFQIMDLILIGIFLILYIPMQIYWIIKIGFTFSQISFQDIQYFENLIEKIEVSNVLKRLFWILFEWKKVIITIFQAFFIFDKEDKQHIIFWLHVGLNLIFIIYYIWQQPFQEKSTHKMIIILELFHTILVILLGIINLQNNSQSPQENESIVETLHKGFSTITQSLFIVQRLFNYIQKLQVKSQNTCGNTSINMVAQLNESNIEQILDILDNTKAYKNKFQKDK
ncbi:hypothetical protein ABPG74_020685 [Tetrahymena malaccensis]